MEPRDRHHHRPEAWPDILPTTGSVYGHVDMAQTTLQIRDIVTDAVLATGPYTAGMETKLEATGAYTWTTNINGPAAAITIASPTGAPLVTVPRSGYKSKVFAAPTQFRFAQDNAGGTGTLKLYPLDGTPPTEVLYFGTVIGWANDGNHFMTNDGTVVHVYSKAGVLVRDVAGPGATAGGWGTNLWFANDTLPGTKARVFTTAPNDAGTLITGGTFAASGRYVVFGETIMDFGVTPPKAVAIGPRPNPFVTTELSHIAFDPNGSGQGLMVDGAGVVQAFHLTSGQGEFYGCGGVTSITGAANGKVVFGTGSGHLVVLDVNAKTASITRRPTSFVALTPDGSKLVHGGPRATSAAAFDVSQLALPGLAVVQASGKANDVAFDATGTTLGLTTIAGAGGGTWTVKNADTNATLATGSWTNNDNANDAFSSGLNPLFALAPDATHFAIWTSGGSARIYANNVLSTVAAGNPLGWLSNQALVTSSGIYDVNGAKVGNATFPGATRRRFQRITDNSVYFPAYDVVIDQSTGNVVVPSSGGTPGATSGAVAGTMIVARPSNRSVLGMRALGVVP